MNDYDKGYIKWFVAAFAFAFGGGMVIKTLITSSEGFSESNLGLNALANFIVPGLCILSQLIMLGIYTRNRQSSQDEEYAKDLAHQKRNEQGTMDDMVIDYDEVSDTDNIYDINLDTETAHVQDNNDIVDSEAYEEEIPDEDDEPDYSE